MAAINKITLLSKGTCLKVLWLLSATGCNPATFKSIYFDVSSGKMGIISTAYHWSSIKQNISHNLGKEILNIHNDYTVFQQIPWKHSFMYKQLVHIINNTTIYKCLKSLSVQLGTQAIQLCHLMFLGPAQTHTHQHVKGLIFFYINKSIDFHRKLIGNKIFQLGINLYIILEGYFPPPKSCEWLYSMYKRACMFVKFHLITGIKENRKLC